MCFVLAGGGWIRSVGDIGELKSCRSWGLGGGVLSFGFVTIHVLHFQPFVNVKTTRLVYSLYHLPKCTAP